LNFLTNFDRQIPKKNAERKKQIKTKSKISAYFARTAAAAVLFLSSVLISASAPALNSESLRERISAGIFPLLSIVTRAKTLKDKLTPLIKSQTGRDITPAMSLGTLPRQRILLSNEKESSFTICLL
jgi:hypothetical protein